MNEKIEFFKQINREYIISSGELREVLGLKGEIIGIVLHSGRSSYEIEKGVSAESESWQILTKEIRGKLNG